MKRPPPKTTRSDTLFPHTTLSRSVALGPRTIWHYIMAMPRKIDLEALCNEKGLRITEQRRVIARVLSDADDHPDVEKVYERASAIDPGISIATVYRSEEHTSELQSLMRISYAVFCLKKKKHH